MHSRDDLSCTRGYESWLVAEAAARNPAIKTFGLSWGVPAWVGNGTYYSTENVDYQVQWVRCLRTATGVDLDYLGASHRRGGVPSLGSYRRGAPRESAPRAPAPVVECARAARTFSAGLWNEKPQPSTSYTKQLRAALDAAGFPRTRLIVMDGGFDAAEVDAARTDAAYRDAVFGAGLHYPVRVVAGWAPQKDLEAPASPHPGRGSRTSRIVRHSEHCDAVCRAAVSPR